MGRKETKQTKKKKKKKTANKTVKCKLSVYNLWIQTVLNYKLWLQL